jgi:hypothetical protein
MPARARKRARAPEAASAEVLTDERAGNDGVTDTATDAPATTLFAASAATHAFPERHGASGVLPPSSFALSGRILLGSGTRGQPATVAIACLSASCAAAEGATATAEEAVAAAPMSSSSSPSRKAGGAASRPPPAAASSTSPPLSIPLSYIRLVFPKACASCSRLERWFALGADLPGFGPPRSSQLASSSSSSSSSVPPLAAPIPPALAEELLATYFEWATKEDSEGGDAGGTAAAPTAASSSSSSSAAAAASDPILSAFHPRRKKARSGPLVFQWKPVAGLPVDGSGGGGRGGGGDAPTRHHTREHAHRLELGANGLNFIAVRCEAKHVSDLMRAIGLTAPAKHDAEDAGGHVLLAAAAVVVARGASSSAGAAKAPVAAPDAAQAAAPTAQYAATSSSGAAADALQSAPAPQQWMTTGAALAVAAAARNHNRASSSSSSSSSSPPVPSETDVAAALAATDGAWIASGDALLLTLPGGAAGPHPLAVSSVRLGDGRPAAGSEAATAVLLARLGLFPTR